ncbi:hypothetical protein PHYBOEH_007771 [Phytophthora boehmeriae]|uniref:Uncharacterized protein n=1 Tax=Phytophthora boehmeriae TaxID=109152 RepID=A0A8T1W5V5_9STRA|nr:hypothetical protein PHYBOEH_007771 [Phytophthora boehmeriae]
MVLPVPAATIRRMIDTVAAIPWSALKSVEETLLWSVPPEPRGPKWADDVFTSAKTVSMPLLLEAFDDGDELTDSCSSGSYSSDGDEIVEWSSDEESLDEGWVDDGEPFAYEAERWYWSPPNSTKIDTTGQHYEAISQGRADLGDYELELGDEHYRRPTMYAMPSMDFSAVDTWVDRYGSNKTDVAYVATVLESDQNQEPQPSMPSVSGFYIPVL